MTGTRYPIDPDCPAVIAFRSGLLDDRTSHQGVSLDDIMEGFAHLHLVNCPRCQNYAARLEKRSK
jgi:hypothetical protein